MMMKTCPSDQGGTVGRRSLNIVGPSDALAARGPLALQRSLCSAEVLVRGPRCLLITASCVKALGSVTCQPWCIPTLRSPLRVLKGLELQRFFGSGGGEGGLLFDDAMWVVLVSNKIISKMRLFRTCA